MAELSNEIKGNYYGLAGFEVVPFNSVVACMLSKRDLSVQELIEEGYRELTLSPLLLEVPISYDRLEVNGFEIVRFLGSGGFSQVYLARCKLDQQYCALKFIRK